MPAKKRSASSQPSTRNLAAIPEPKPLRALMESVALLEEILCDDWEDRCYSFDPKWGAGEAMASMRNGSGDEWFLWFGKKGLVLLGFDHEASPMTPYARKDKSLWPGMLTGFPDELKAALAEPAFSPGDHTFIVWRLATDDRYRIGDIVFPQRKAIEPYKSDPDGSTHLLSILDGDPKTYAELAEDNYELDDELDLAAVKKVYAHQPITKKLVATLNQDADFAEIAKSAKAMGFTVGK